MLKDGVGNSRLLGVVLAGQVVVNAASFMSIPLLALFLLKDLEYDPYRMGAVLTTLLIFTRASPIFTGGLADRWGYKRFILIGLFSRVVGFASISTEYEVMIFLGVALIGLGGSLYESGTYGYLARINKIRADAFYLNNQALNLGVIAGPLLAFFVPHNGYGEFFIFSAVVFFLLAFLFLLLTPDDLRSDTLVQPPCFFDLVADVYKDKIFLLFNLISVPWWFLFSQLYVFLPLSFSDRKGTIQSELLIYVVNGIVGIALTIIFLRRISTASPLALMVLGHSVLAVAYLLPMINSSADTFLMMIVVFSIGETLIMPAMDNFIARIAPAGHEANYFGIANIPWIIGASVGNMLGGKLYSSLEATTAWVTLSVVAAVGWGMSLSFIAWLKTRHIRSINEQ